jgi:hypothetical protein
MFFILRYIAINMFVVISYLVEIHNLNNKVIHKITLSFTPYPLFQWYPQGKEILLNLRMKCWVSWFNAQGSRVIIVVRSSENICSSSGSAQEKENTRWNSVYHQNWWKKVWVQSLPFVKFSFPVTHSMPYYAEIDRSRPLIAHQNWWKKFWVPVITFCKIFISVTRLMPYYAETGRSHPLITHQNWWKKVWVPVITFCKIFIPVTHLMPYYAETGRSHPLIAWLYG